MKHLIFIGGEVGSLMKQDVAKKIKEHTTDSLIIDDDACHSIIEETLFGIYNKLPNQKTSPEYIHKIAPLKEKSLDAIVRQTAKINDSTVIITSQYFNSFSRASWLREMRYFASNHDFKINFLFLKNKTIKEKVFRNRRRVDNDALRQKIDSQIKNINENENIVKIELSGEHLDSTPLKDFIVNNLIKESVMLRRIN